MRNMLLLNLGVCSSTLVMLTELKYDTQMSVYTKVQGFIFEGIQNVIQF